MSHHRSRYRSVLAAGLLLTVLAGAGCDEPAAGPAPVATEQRVPRLVRQADGSEAMELNVSQMPGLTVATVAAKPLAGVLETNGEVSFDQRRVATIVSRVAGRIEEVRVTQWDRVRRGQVILSLYSPDFMTAEAEYLQALVTDRMSARLETNPGTNLAPALVSAARRKLELLGMDAADIAALRAPAPTVRMRAPIGGVVVENKAVRGAQVNPGDVLYSLGSLDRVWITASVYEEDLARVRVGQELEAVTTAFPNEVFRGQVARISPNIDPDTHTARIRCELRNPAGRLKPQMLARVRLITAPGRALVVPQSAVVFDTNAYYVFVVQGADRVVRRRVSLGSWNEHGYARIASGVEPGQRVVNRESLQVLALWHLAHGESS